MTTPTHLERQLRAGLARLMTAETEPAGRMAQIRWIEALLTIETLAALLAIIDAERAKTPTEAQLFALLPGVWYMDEPDGGAPDLLTMLQRMADDATKWRAWVRQNPPPVPMPPPLSFAGAPPFPGNPAAQPVPPSTKTPHPSASRNAACLDTTMAPNERITKS